MMEGGRAKHDETLHLATTRLPAKSLRLGDLIRVRYKDHALQRNVDPEKAQPIIREAVGVVERDSDDYVYLMVDEYAEPGPDGDSVRKTSGFVILKSTILEVNRLA
jgi:hypothetical protein